MKITIFLTALCVAGLSHAATPPVAEQRPHLVTSPNGDRNDPYYWLRDDTRKDPQMLAYLRAENAFTDAVLAPEAGLRETLFKEITARVKPNDDTAPYFRRGYWYYARYEAGGDYPIYARKAGALTAPEDVMLDGPRMAQGKGFFMVGGAVVSQDNRLLAWAEDDVGRRQYGLHFKDLKTGEILADVVPNVERDFVWADDGRTVFYVDKDPVTLLSKRIKAHVLGTPVSDDRLVYEEADPSYYMGIERTRDDRYLCIELQSTIDTEQRCAAAADPKTFAVLFARQKGRLDHTDHLDARWVIRTNWDAPNYRLMSLPDGAPWNDRAQWRPLVPHDPTVFIEDIALFHGAVVTEERSGGLKRLRIRASESERFVAADESAYAMALATNADPDATSLNYTYDSLTTPTTTYSLDLKTGARTLFKRDSAVGYDPANYVTERVWITARDGVKIPVSLAYRKGFKRDGTAAMLQYAYGSYGRSSDPHYGHALASLLDRGMVYAIAHVRGGQEMGRAWFDDGHLLKKINTFNDFVDVTEGLVKLGYAAKDRVAAQGGSAGGLLMGAIANRAPQDYRVLIAQVPFVDAVTTMLDESIPLTTNEFDQWGNPKEKIYYDYILSYSPYDNVARHAYPALFVTGGLWDSQVQYFEPAKWVARLRAMKTDANPLVFRLNWEASHGGKSGRYQRYHDVAEVYAFMLDQLGVR